MRVALMGGGSAGHLFPSVAVAQRLREHGEVELLFIGAQGRLDEGILAQQGLPHELIPARPFPYRLSPALIPAAWGLVQSVRRCLGVFRRFRPDAVFGSGGYVSVAGILAATRLHIPTVCHASDAHADRANRLLARWATRVTTHYAVTAQSFPAGKTTVVGQPVRREFFQAQREPARQDLGIPPQAFVLLVCGGSQGARTLNTAALAALPGLLADPDTHVLQMTGATDHEAIVQGAAEAVGPDHPRYRCTAFFERPWEPYAAADLCLTRGGASSLAELGVMGVPMMVTPYPYAAAHQKLNAAPLAQAGAALVVDNSELTGDWLLARVRELRGDRERLERMSVAARTASRPQAAEEIAQILREVAARGG